MISEVILAFITESSAAFNFRKGSVRSCWKAGMPFSCLR